jgi:hypothetical protein
VSTEGAMYGLKFYMKEREAIRRKKEARQPWPWTKDKILSTYKFTNVKRAHDRTTRAFVDFYEKHRSHWAGKENVLLYNCGIARYFGTEAFQREAGWQDKHHAATLTSVATRMLDDNEKVFTGAYIITSAGRSGPKQVVVAEYLGGLWKRAPGVVAKMSIHQSWARGYEALVQAPGFGGSGFMAKEVLQDFLLMTTMHIKDVHNWTPMGPGARRGMNRLLGRDKNFKQGESKFIDEVQGLWLKLKDWWLETYPDADELTAHDVQFCLCEFDKYERTRTGEGRPRSLYSAPEAG